MCGQYIISISEINNGAEIINLCLRLRRLRKSSVLISHVKTNRIARIRSRIIHAPPLTWADFYPLPAGTGKRSTWRNAFRGAADDFDFYKKRRSPFTVFPLQGDGICNSLPLSRTVNHTGVYLPCVLWKGHPCCAGKKCVRKITDLLLI